MKTITAKQIIAGTVGTAPTSRGWTAIAKGVSVASKMQRFAITFGTQYRHEEHPTFKDAHPDGYVVIVAPDEGKARDLAFREIGADWAFIYCEEDIDPGLFPLGEICCLDYEKLIPEDIQR